MNTSRVLVDTNALVVILLGLMDPKIINSHSRTSIYEEEDFVNVMYYIEDLKNIVVLPNIIAEVDNLLNGFSGNMKYPYLIQLTLLIKQSSEEYLHSIRGTECDFFNDLGITDSLVLELALTCDALITGDSKLADHARASGINVLDLVELRNNKLKS